MRKIDCKGTSFNENMKNSVPITWKLEALERHMMEIYASAMQQFTHPLFDSLLI